MKKKGIIIVIAFLGLVYKTNSQVFAPTEVETKMKDRYCLFGGKVCPKTIIKGTLE